MNSTTPTDRSCTVTICDRDRESKLYCKSHQKRLRKYGDVFAERPLVYGKTFRTHEELFWSKVDKSGECWTWQREHNKRGYGLFKGLSGKRQFAHRVSYQMAYGVDPGDLYVCHHCDNPPCVRPDHLFLGTAVENNADMRAKERHARGVKVPQAKLTEDDVRCIRNEWATGKWRQWELGCKYNVDQGQISRIVRHKDWKHVS